MDKSFNNYYSIKKNKIGVEDSGCKQQNKYRRVKEVTNINGFVVNVHDATNLDIDLDLPPELKDKYQDVILNNYTYQDLQPDVLGKPNIVPSIGTTYRCRLRGIGINQLSYQARNQKSNQMYVEVSRLIDRADGWIICTLSDVDIYRRLLVDITIHTCKGTIDLKEYLLSRMENEEMSNKPIYYPYSIKK